MHDDQSDAGWNTVKEYVKDDMGSDSDDAKKIRMAEKQSIEKIEKTWRTTVSECPPVKNTHLDQHSNSNINKNNNGDLAGPDFC